ncbi:MAG: glutamate synthase large subunit [Alphaproteobacteria bacterium]|jgi:glutamate synthase (NADPH/NADH) large chain
MSVNTPMMINGFACNAAGEPFPFGLCAPSFEHDSCGIGFIVRLDGCPSHALVEKGVTILKNLEHRCAIGADRKTSDGAGLMLQIPDAFFRKVLPYSLPKTGEYAVGQLFLPRDSKAADFCLQKLGEAVENAGCRLIGQRDVPTDGQCLGELAARTVPAFRQVFIAGENLPETEFVRRLYVIRRETERAVKAVRETDMSLFYVCSLSPRTIVYKGLVAGSGLAAFYRDLQDEDFAVSFCIAHSRYSTNTLPTWRMAQPFRYVAHNGEINTLRGNVNHIRALEPGLAGDAFGADIEKIRPIVDETGSDTMIFDNVLEMLVTAGRSLPHSMMMMVPEAFGDKFVMSEDKRAFYEYHAALMEPWDGPAAMIFTDGKSYIGGLLDRNGLRPCRYTVTRDGYVIMASESGVIDVAPDNIRRRGKLTPGKMFLVDLRQNRIVSDSEIKGKISRQSPYRHWVRDNRIQLHNLYAPEKETRNNPEKLSEQQRVFGYNEEELKLILNAMASNAQEPIGSMGFDAPLAVLSKRPQLLFNYFKQQFAQVTNPPIDPLREEMVMSLMSFIGRERNLLSETPAHFRRLKLSSPLLERECLANLERIANDDIRSVRLSAVFPVAEGGEGLRRALENLAAEAEKSIRDGADILILSDLGYDSVQAPIPSLLAVSGLHHALIRKGLRYKASLIVETGEAREVIHFAQLIAFGANAVCPVTALETVRSMAENNMLEKSKTPDEAVAAYMTAARKGLLKCFSRVGISTVRSFWGSQVFEAVGLSDGLIHECFTGTPSGIGGIGLEEIADESAARHQKAFGSGTGLDEGGYYRLQRNGEEHMWTPKAALMLRKAVRENDYALYRKYSAEIEGRTDDPLTLRHLLRFKTGGSVCIDEVEPVEKIMKRFVSAAMSMGSINRETHETIAIAMNRVGGRSNSGEGGEDPGRYHVRPNGDNLCSRIKQIASGRFGVTAEYLVNAEELQIKLAQGAKPGEGGQLPAHKVTDEIARIRHTVSGVSLISPPPHHDIYSIEDLAQLISDLKMINPEAAISVKLVAKAGVGTIAAGVAKAKADIVIIAGYDGGTGASPMTAIRHTGLPWELGVAEAQQALIANGLRDRIRIQTDGQLKTGRDLAVAALLGAEEFGFGTALLIALGCCMDRKCHLDTCPMGLATQNPELRERFEGRPEHIINFLRFIAQELREYMAELGFRTVDEMVGRVERLELRPDISLPKASKIDFSRLLAVPQTEIRRCTAVRQKEKDGFDNALLPMVKDALRTGLKTTFSLPVHNTDRTVGTRLSGEVVRMFGARGVPDESITLELTGSAGQSLGAFLAPGITLRINGDANDYVGKGLSGGRIIIRHPPGAGFIPCENVIIGNVALYGATSGEAYFAGMAGERFAVRNSGARAVVEGVGDHGCEYMTGGTVVILGSTGYNFAAGMSGGIAYVYDETEIFQTRCNLDSVDLENVWSAEDRKVLRELLDKHYQYTGSTHAKKILDNWENRFPLFVKVVPVEYRKVLDRMKRSEGRNAEALSATEEVYI